MAALVHSGTLKPPVILLGVGGLVIFEYSCSCAVKHSGSCLAFRLLCAGIPATGFIVGMITCINWHCERLTEASRFIRKWRVKGNSLVPQLSHPIPPALTSQMVGTRHIMDTADAEECSKRPLDPAPFPTTTSKTDLPRESYSYPRLRPLGKIQIPLDLVDPMQERGIKLVGNPSLNPRPVHFWRDPGRAHVQDETISPASLSTGRLIAI